MGKTKALSAGTLALLLHLFVSGTAEAQATGDKAAAEALFQTGRELMTAGKFSEACSKLEASQRLDAGLGTLLYLADCYEKAGRTASAWATFREAESIAEGRSDSARSQIAKDRSAALEPRLSKLWVKVSPNNPDDIQVLRDGALVPRESWGIALPTDAGQHTVTASAPGHKPWSTKVAIDGDKETASVEVPALEIAPEEPKPPPGVGVGDRGFDEHPGRTQRILGIVTSGVGIVGLGFGTFFGLRASTKNDDSKQFCGQNSDANLCEQHGKDLRDAAFTSADTATGLFIAGGALLVGGAVIYFTAPSSATEAARAPALRFAAGGSSARVSLGGAW
jgi:serine/threonine-protein kinase